MKRSQSMADLVLKWMIFTYFSSIGLWCQRGVVNIMQTNVRIRRIILKPIFTSNSFGKQAGKKWETIAVYVFVLKSNTSPKLLRQTTKVKFKCQSSFTAKILLEDTFVSWDFRVTWHSREYSFIIVDFLQKCYTNWKICHSRRLLWPFSPLTKNSETQCPFYVIKVFPFSGQQQTYWVEFSNTFNLLCCTIYAKQLLQL